MCSIGYITFSITGVTLGLLNAYFVIQGYLLSIVPLLLSGWTFVVSFRRVVELMRDDFAS